MPAKNRKKTLLYSGLATGAIAMLGLAAITPKEDRTVALVRGERLNVPSFVAPKSPKTQNSLIYIAIFLGLISSGCSIGMALVASKRQEELPKERQEYEIELEAQRRIAGANAARRVAVATNAAKMAADAEIEIYSNDLLGKFEAVAERSNWVALPEPEKPTKASALAEVKAQLEELEAKSREFDQARLSQANSPDNENEAEKKSTLSDSPKLPKLTNYPAVLICGPQGSGKTFLAEEEIKERKQAGHKVTALDPHAAFNSWRDCEVIGAGMDYEAIDAALASFAIEVKKRYKRIREEPNPQFEPWTFVCDEFTNWASRCKASGEFFQAALSDIRKAKMYVIFVSHARTLAGLGDAKGMAATRDAALLEIELLGQIDPVTTEAVPKFEALVKLPGQPLSDRALVKLTKHPTPTAPTATPDNTDTAESNSAYLDRVYNLEFDLSKPEPSKPGSEPLNQPQDKTNSKSEPKFTPLNLTREQALELIQRLRTELNQTQLIEKLWDCKKGGSEAWKRAYAEFKELTKENEE